MFNINSFVTFAAALTFDKIDFEEFKKVQLELEKNNTQQLDTTEHSNHVNFADGTYHSNHTQKPDAEKEFIAPTLHTNTYTQGGLPGNMEHADFNGEHTQHSNAWTHTNAGKQSGYHWDVPHTNTEHVDCFGHLDQYNQHSNNFHTNTGFDHQNYIPSKPIFFNIEQDKQLSGVVTIAMFSYDKNNDGDGTQDEQSKTIKYDLSIRRVSKLDNTPDDSGWKTLAENYTKDTYDLNTLDPLGVGIDDWRIFEGYYELQITAKNDPINKNTISKTYVSQTQTIRVKIKQNKSPELTVQNGNEFINFYFSDLGVGKVGTPLIPYDLAFSEAPGSQKQGLFVVVTMKDETYWWDNWQKGTVCLKEPSGAQMTPSVDIIWADSGTNVISSANAEKRGYAFIPKELFTPAENLQGVKVVLSVQDFLDPDCTMPAGEVVERSTVSSIDLTNLVINVDTVAPNASSYLNPSNWTNGDVTISVSGTDFGGSGVWRILLPDGTTWVNGENATYTVHDNGTYTFVIEDNVGNSKTLPVEVNNIERIAPTISVNPISQDIVHVRIPVNVTVTDEVGGSGFREMRYAWSNNIQKPESGWLSSYSSNTTVDLTSEGEYYLHVEGVDNAGNSTYAAYGPYKLTMPVINIDYKMKPYNPIFKDIPIIPIPAGEKVELVANDDGGIIVQSNTPISSTEVYIENLANYQKTKVGELSLESSIENERDYTYYYNIYEYMLPDYLTDGNYVIHIQANAEISVIKNSAIGISIYTPVWEDYFYGKLEAIPKPLDGVPDVIEPIEPLNPQPDSRVRILTSKYTGKLKIVMDDITFYALNNGYFSLNEDGSDAVQTLIVNTPTQEYRARNLIIERDKENPDEASDYRWSFDFVAVDGRPLNYGESFWMEVTAYDTAGQWDVNDFKHNLNPQYKAINGFVVKLFSFAVTDIRDRKFKYLFNGSGRTYTVPNLPIDQSDHNEGLLMKKGYAFYFELNSYGLNQDNDTVRIRPRFYSAETGEQLDMYYSTANHPYVLATSEYGSPDPNDTVKIYYEKEMTNLLGYHNEIYLPTSLRTIVDSRTQAWHGRYGIPTTAIFVRKGDDPSITTNRIMTPVIVNFEIDAIKGGALQYDYVEKNQWRKERFGRGIDPINTLKYYNPKYKEGDVILIDPAHSIVDDYEATPTH